MRQSNVARLLGRFAAAELGFLHQKLCHDLVKAHLVRDWLARANVFFAEHRNLFGANSPLAGAVECVTLVVVDDEQRAVFRLNTVGIRRLSFIQ